MCVCAEVDPVIPSCLDENFELHEHLEKQMHTTYREAGKAAIAEAVGQLEVAFNEAAHAVSLHADTHRQRWRHRLAGNGVLSDKTLGMVHEQDSRDPEQCVLRWQPAVEGVRGRTGGSPCAGSARRGRAAGATSARPRSRRPGRSRTGG